MNEIYKQEVLKYNKKDGIIALSFFVFYCILMFMLGVVRRLGVDPLFSGIGVSVIAAIALILLLLLKKDGMSSIGFHKENLWSAIRLGLFFGLIPLLLSGGLLPGIVIYGWQVAPIGQILLATLFTFIFAAHEDMIFVGYIQTRLYGLIKRDILAVFVGALLFSLMHIMPQIGFYGLAGLNANNLMWLA
ncbi:MAG: CPBP family glutamic-type intramembrane protease, partial [Defluviitaleaceae bacterium]|nr:CPBP family glutamic-type intramembrane protease [Defluviitaleaceae bacterium]